VLGVGRGGFYAFLRRLDRDPDPEHEETLGRLHSYPGYQSPDEFGRNGQRANAAKKGVLVSLDDLTACPFGSR